MNMLADNCRFFCCVFIRKKMKSGQSKQTKMPYFESGWVDEEELEKERLRKEKSGNNPFKFW